MSDVDAVRAAAAAKAEELEAVLAEAAEALELVDTARLELRAAEGRATALVHRAAALRDELVPLRAIMEAEIARLEEVKR